ncbi:MAG: hypothetical protein PW792_02455 [Acidobacteriaceae bacterium]|nr:hypothetical protein [Acidobacteriaceae bacterium]
MQHLCPRCTYAVQSDEDGSLTYCSHCGMPQVRLSEELADRIATERAALEEGEAVRAEAPPLAADGSVAATTSASAPVAADRTWRHGVKAAAICAGIALVLAIVSLPLPAVSLLAFLWAVGAPVAALGFYVSLSKQTVLSSGFGARLGILTGLLVMMAMSTVNTVDMLLQRYVWHNAGRVDGQLEAMFAQIRAAMMQSTTGADAATVMSVAHTFDQPEFRAGLLLTSMALFCLSYLGFSAVGGAFAGALRSRKVR